MENLQDQKLYEKNLEVLKNRNPKLFEQIQKAAVEETAISIECSTSREQVPFMSITKETLTMYVHSKFKPLLEAERWASQIKIQHNSPIFIFGLGLGYHLLELAKKVNEENYIIVIEPSTQVFLESMKRVDLSNILENDKINLMIGQEYKSFLWNYVSWLNVENMIYCSITNYHEIFLHEYKEFMETMKELKCLRTSERETILLHSERWQNNIFKNTPYAFKGAFVKQFYNIFKNKPGILVSAGPSLNKNVHLLKNAKDKAVIVCVDTALKVLLKEGIQPDIVISIDGHILNYEKFKGIQYDDIPLVYSLNVYPQILSDHKGRKVLFSSGDEESILRFFESKGIQIGQLSIGGSVATCGFDLLKRMGCDPVVFVGQDLAYTENKTHADGSMYDGKNEVKKHEEYLTVQGINGETLKTNYGLYVFLVWFQNQIKVDQTRTFIDATEGGAYIEGTVIQTLKQVIDQYCNEKIEVTQIISNIFEQLQITSEIIKGFIEEYTKLSTEFICLSEKCRKAVSYNKELFKIYESNQFYSNRTVRILEKLDKIDQFIFDKQNEFALLKYILQPTIYQVHNHLLAVLNETEREKGMRIAKKGQMLYEGFLSAIQKVEESLKLCIAEMEKID